jgi:hypothetical protein
VSTVPRHSEEELRQQWAFLDALVDRQAASLKSGNQDPEEEDLPVATAVPVDNAHLEEISTLTRRVATLESERAALLRRIDLAEQARMAAEAGRAAAEAGRAAAEAAGRAAVERALADAQARKAAAAAAPQPVVQRPPAVTRIPASPARKPPAAKARRRSWWQRFRE